mmetsp:Transcript_22790/g.63329  ORF Transcript_22790/g.63329 Transcript_22790/m.63329 type:complete len:305 (+) Transcript_22790:122-1036(+)
MPCRTMPCRTMPCRTMPYHAGLGPQAVHGLGRLGKQPRSLLLGVLGGHHGIKGRQHAGHRPSLVSVDRSVGGHRDPPDPKQTHNAVERPDHQRVGVPSVFFVFIAVFVFVCIVFVVAGRIRVGEHGQFDPDHTRAFRQGLQAAPIYGSSFRQILPSRRPGVIDHHPGRRRLADHRNGRSKLGRVELQVKDQRAQTPVEKAPKPTLPRLVRQQVAAEGLVPGPARSVVEDLPDPADGVLSRAQLVEPGFEQGGFQRRARYEPIRLGGRLGGRLRWRLRLRCYRRRYRRRCVGVGSAAGVCFWFWF